MGNCLIVGMIAFMLVGCQTLQKPAERRYPMTGESLVLAGQAPGKLLFTDVDENSVRVRSTYVVGDKTIRYEAGKDYVLDAKAGTIARTAGSRIPDFATNVLYGKKDFNHGAFPGYGNLAFFVYVDYAAAKGFRLATPSDQSERLPKTRAKLQAGEPLKLMAYGDSIAAGGEASTTSLQFPLRYADYLREQYPKASISFENGSTGGDTTREGLVRLNDKVLTRSPDLVLVAFGMNDHNIGSTPIPEYKTNLKTIIEQIRTKTGAEIILLSTFPPNPLWHHSSHRMELYAAATKEVADETNVAFADLYATWELALARKDPESLLANNINHPNDFGHRLYLESLKAVRF